jgi:pilus assembly protein CpaC
MRPMKYIAPICVMLALSITAYGQQPGPGIQVVVHLQISEVSLTKLQRLGLSLEKLAGNPNAKSNNDPTNGDARTVGVIDDGSEAQQFLETLRKDHLVKVLADPTMVTLSGRTAVFRNGGELSVPNPQQNGSTTIEYGTTVKVTPEVLDDKIRLAIHGRLAELDYEHTVRAGKETAPGVQVREFTTRTELKSGQTLVINGLTQVRMEAINRGVPCICEIPYLGAIFRTVEERHNEVAMLVLVRPEIVQAPATAAHPAIAGSQGEVPAPQTERPINSSGNVFPTARRSTDGDTRR